MRKIPLFDSVGTYGLFFTNRIEMYNYTSNVLSELKENYKIFYVSSEAKQNIESIIHNISWDQYNSYLHPKLPNWIRDEETFNKCIRKDYNSITPQSAELIPTLNCCFRCEQCSYQKIKINNDLWYNNKNNNSITFNMNINDAKIIIDKLLSVNTRNIVFTGGGEPLVNKETTLFGMRYSKSKGINVGLYTNGYYLSDKTIDEILEIEPLFIRISVYGVDSTAFSKYTNSIAKNYYIVINNIKSLIRKKKIQKSNTKIALSFLVHPTLYPDPNSILDFFQKHFFCDELRDFAYIRFTPAVNYDGVDQHNYSFFENICNIVKVLSNKYSNFTKIVFYNHRLNDLYKIKPYTKCLASGFFAEVSPNGDMYHCCEKLMDTDYKIGNLINDSINTIFCSEKRIKLINEINLKSCRHCPSLCKPHEINKQLNMMESLDAKIIAEWRNELISIAEDEPIFSGAFNAFES